MNRLLSLLLISAALCHNVKAASPTNNYNNHNIVQAVQGTLKALPSTQTIYNRNYRENLKPIRFVLDRKMVEDCKFEKKVFVSDTDYINLTRKNCDELIDRMTYDRSYNAKNIILFEFIPLSCTNKNFTGQLFTCD